MTDTDTSRPSRRGRRGSGDWPNRPGGRSKRVSDRSKDVYALCASIERRKAGAAAGMGSRFEGVLREGEVLPDHALSLDLAGRSLLAALDGLMAAEDRYCGGGVARGQHRGECERVAREELYPKVVDVRRTIDAAFGRKDGRWIHGLHGKTRRKARRQCNQVRRMVLALEARGRELPEPRVAGFAADRDVWLKLVKPPFEKLVAMLRELDRLEGAEVEAREQLEVAIGELDDEYLEVLRYAEALYALGDVSARSIWNLRSYVQRRRLRRHAHSKREARSARKARTPEKPGRPAARPAGSVVTVLAEWLGWRRPSRG
ncbi:MAG: hypothetical protein GY719_06560 [bacterium]|nr:hypothetical protein [bacterium]